MRHTVSAFALLALCGCQLDDLAFWQEEPGAAAATPEAATPPSTEPALGSTPTIPQLPTMPAPTGAALSPAPPPTAAKAPTEEEAARFLVQASFGGSGDDVAEVQSLGLEGWVLKQASLPLRPVTPRVLATPDAKRSVLTDLFWAYAIENDDQLRQRVAYALSQIVVISAGHDLFWGEPELYARYMDILQDEALGNYADLVKRVSVTPAMGVYLSSIQNKKHDPESGARPDENFAREVMQLFTIGLEELEMDGTPTGRPTYTNEDIMGLASVFTGMSWKGTHFLWPDLRKADMLADMAAYPEYHEQGPKRFLGTAVTATTPQESVDQALDHLLSHRNLAPFVSKQLIQRLVTSNPSKGYVSRVATAFERGRYAMPSGRSVGEGRRGDMTATVAAILLDEEARSEAAADRPEFGRVREPILRFAQLARAFRDDGGAPKSGPAVDVGQLRWSGGHGLGQQALEPPSVFGFSRPGYKAPGSWSAEKGMVAPELSLTGGARSVGFAEFLFSATNQNAWGQDFWRFDYEEELLPLVGDPAALADRVDTLLAYGTMTDETKARIVRAVESIKLEGNAETIERRRNRRAGVAVFLAATAPSFSVQR